MWEKKDADQNKLGKKKIQTLKASQMTVSNGSLHPILSVLAPLDMHSRTLSWAARCSASIEQT